MAQVPDRQVASPLGSNGHATQDGPQAVASLSCAHKLPQAWYPVAQVNPHLVPSQVACEAPAGTGQTAQEGPQPVTSFATKQKPLQRLVPVGQEPAQLTFGAMQTPSQSTFGAGQVPPHDFPSQVALPPFGTVHAVQAVPQLLGSSSRTQLPPHACSPFGQVAATGKSTPESTDGTTTVAPVSSELSSLIAALSPLVLVPSETDTSPT